MIFSHQQVAEEFVQETVVLSDSFGYILIVGTHESVMKPLADL